MLLALLCTFCFLTTPDGVPYLHGQGSYISEWSPNRDDVSYGFAAGVTRVGGKGLTVAGQFNAHAMHGVSAQTFGVATEAVAQTGSNSILVGLESLVVNQESTNDSAKIGINIVWRSDVHSNKNSIGLWFSSYPNSGFETGIKFDKVSLKTSSQKRAAIIDLSDLDPDEIKDMDLIRFPGGKVLRWNGSSLLVY